jgi:hypothetical protein
MAHGTEQHLEHAEHAQHHAIDPFDRRVAMSMTIMAAVLAGATMLSHRGHNETLRLETEANIHHTKAADIWAFYQATNIRSHEYQTYLLNLHLQGKTKLDKEQENIRNYLVKQVNKYNGDGYWAKTEQAILSGKKAEDGKAGTLANRREEAEKLEATANNLQAESAHVHHSVNWIDYGHLGLELALVLCSVAVLSKQKPFWLSGLLVAVVGAGLALLGVVGILTHH